jgi:hypothetical protein
MLAVLLFLLAALGCATQASPSPKSRPAATCGVFGVTCAGGGCCPEGFECRPGSVCEYAGTDGSLTPLGKRHGK